MEDDFFGDYDSEGRDSDDDSSGSFGEGERQEEGLEFGVGPSDWDRVGMGGPVPLVGKRGHYVDPRDTALAEFGRAFRARVKGEDELEGAIEKIRDLPDLLDTNMELLAIAACFYVLYAGRGGVTKANFASFVADNASDSHPVDVLRHIRRWETL